MTDRLAGLQTHTFLPRAIIDEPCHLATAVVVLAAYARRQGPPGRWFAGAMLSASVLIDIDHLPLEFGSTAWTAGTPRPYTHALWLVAALATVAIIATRRSRVSGGTGASMTASLSAGVTLGVCAHFLRDVATAPIALWWPVSSVGVVVPGIWYVAALLVLAAVPPARLRSDPAVGRAQRARTASRNALAVTGRRRPSSQSAAARTGPAETEER